MFSEHSVHSTKDNEKQIQNRHNDKRFFKLIGCQCTGNYSNIYSVLTQLKIFIC